MEKQQNLSMGRRGPRIHLPGTPTLGPNDPRGGLVNNISGITLGSALNHDPLGNAISVRLTK
jgi:hypothetical protein